MADGTLRLLALHSLLFGTTEVNFSFMVGTHIKEKTEVYGHERLENRQGNEDKFLRIQQTHVSCAD